MNNNAVKVMLTVSASVAFILALLGALAPRVYGGIAAKNTVEEINADIARRVIEEVWNDGNPTRASQLYAPLFHWQSGAGRITNSYRPEEWVSAPDSQLQAIRHSFPDLQIMIEKIVVTGDTAAVCYSGRGTFKEALNVTRLGGSSYVAPTGKEEYWDGVFMYRFEDGKIVDEWWYWDTDFEAIIN
jgi:predicted ester cyclase